MWWAHADDGDAEMEAVDEQQGELGDGTTNRDYVTANALLKEMHYLRQLRKLQSERRVASHSESALLLPLPLQHQLQYYPPPALRDPRN